MTSFARSTLVFVGAALGCLFACGSDDGDGSPSTGGGSGTGGASNGGSAGSGGGAGAGGAAASGGAAGLGGSPGGGGAPGGGGSAAGGGAGGGAGNCPAAPAGSDADQTAALAAVNKARLAMGVPCSALVSSISTAAEKHCLYYTTNTGSCIANPHAEVAGCKNFVAASFGGRMKAAGYTGSPASEVMVFGPDPNGAVKMWIDSVWHRTPVLSPWVRELGYGNATGCGVMDLGVGAATPNTVIAKWPYDKQTGVPLAFSGNEGPKPPAPPSGWPSGYPVTLYAKSPVITEHTLVVEGTTADIPHVWIAGDALLSKSAVVLYAHKPLQAKTTYRVHIKGTFVGGPLDEQWTFTTQ